MKFTRIMLLLGILGFSACYADTDNPDWLDNEVSLGFYNHNFIDVTFDGPSRLLSPGSGTTPVNNPLDGVIGFYQHLIYHTQKHFSIYWGVSAARWTYESLPVLTASGFVSFRYWPIRTDYVNPYIDISVAGPSLVSRQMLGDSDLGGPILFQNYLGVGMQIGKTPAFNVEAAIMHYSNGGTFPANDGFNVPLVLLASYSF